MNDKPEQGERVKGSRSRDLMERFIRELPNSIWPDSEDRDLYLKAARVMLPRYLRAHKYLEQSGWFESVKQQRPVDRKKNPLPWYTYPAISYLSAKDVSALSVFEFGSGGSTLWWAARARHASLISLLSASARSLSPAR